MNDVSNRAVREFSEFLNSIEADFPKPTCTTAYEITMASSTSTAAILTGAYSWYARQTPQECGTPRYGS